MTSVITSPHRGTSTPERAGVEWLRCPGERTAFVLCVLSNLVVIAFAVAVVLAGTEWLESHPIIARRIDVLRAIVIAAIFALPAASLARNTGFAAARGDGVRVTEQQFPELYAQLLDACRKLDIDRIPEIYISRKVEGRAAEAHTRWDGRSLVVLNADLVGETWVETLDALTFAVAGALGAIRLGHTRWWVELLTVYARRIPGLRTPILVKWTHSRDRCAAFVVPDGVRGLIIEAVGKDAISSVDVPAFVDQTKQRTHRFWESLATMRRKAPSLVARAHVLYDGGFFDRERDRQRHVFGPTSAMTSARARL